MRWRFFHRTHRFVRLYLYWYLIRKNIAMRSSDGFRNWSILIPINIGTVAAALIILEGIGQHSRIGANSEVV